MTSTLKVRNIEMGEGAASDSKILFDGNAQDFHIGLDDSTDSLTIGLGSALGTTSHMVFDANGHITKPLQPSFLVHKNANQTNFALNQVVDVVYQVEIFDVNGDISSNTFTAPVTGKYLLGANLILGQPQTDAAYIEARIETSNRNYSMSLNDYDFGDQITVYWTINGTFVCDMDAGDTAVVRVNQSGGTQATDIYSSSEGTLFFGSLLS